MRRKNVLKKSMVNEQTSSSGRSAKPPLVDPKTTIYVISTTTIRDKMMTWRLLVKIEELVVLRLRRRKKSSGDIGGARDERAWVCVLTFVSGHNHAWVAERSLHSLLHVTWRTSATIVTPTHSQTLHYMTISTYIRYDQHTHQPWERAIFDGLLAILSPSIPIFKMIHLAFCHERNSWLSLFRALFISRLRFYPIIIQSINPNIYYPQKIIKKNSNFSLTWWFEILIKKVDE